jgi:L-asparaginase
VPKLFHDSAAVPPGAFYITREIDAGYIDALRANVDATDVGPHIHGSRQSGKSSLLMRARAALVDDFTAILVDLQGRFAVKHVHPGPEALTVTDFWTRLFLGGLVPAIQRTAEEHPARASFVAESLLAFGDVGPTDPVRALSVLIAALAAAGKPLIVLIDELDRLGDDYRAELCRVFRAVGQDCAGRADMRFNLSLVGVLPPVRTGDSPAVHAGIEHVGGEALWLDDFRLDGRTVAQVRDIFHSRSATQGFRDDDARAILEYTGGYPQAVAWVGNQIAAASDNREVSFSDESFRDRIRELCVPTLRRHAAGSDPAGWLGTLADYFMGHTDVRHLHATAEALKIYEQLLDAAADPAKERTTYQPESEAYQTLRFSGMARLDDDGKLRIRAPLFADVFDTAWAARMRSEVYGRESAAYARWRKPHRPGKSKYASEKRLLILATGGTIGMLETPAGSIGVGEDLLPEWAFEAKELLGQLPTVRPMFGLDGADVGPEHWRELARYILLNQTDFDGVVITHGTDTLCFTACAVAFALGRELSFPVVFTGSQTTTDVLHGDSISNILRACLVATQDVPEVVVSFGEKVFRAVRTQKKDDLRFDAFESPGYPELGFVAEEVQIFRRSLLSKAGASAALMRRSTEFESGILHISQTPGCDAAFYLAALRVARRAANGERQPLCRGIIIQSLGAGNIPTKDPAFSLEPLIKEASEQLIPVILTSPFPVLPANYLRYSPSTAAIAAGAIPTGNMTISAVVTKLSWVLPQVNADIENELVRPERRLDRIKVMMSEELVGEGGFPVIADNSDDS